MRVPACAWTIPALLLAAALPGAAETRIQHEPAACLLAESYPRLTAVIAPGDQVVRARLLFRPEPNVMAPPAALGTSSSRARSGDTLDDRNPLDGGGGDRAPGATPSPWYAVAMTREGDTFSAVLPRPRMAVGKVRYVIEVTDAAAASVRDKEHVVEVVGTGSACGTAKVAEVVGSAQVVVEVPPGAPLIPPVPQGFSPVGATAVEGSLGLVHKGGRHKGLFLALGGAALGGAAAASQLSGGEAPAPPASGPLPPGFTVVSTFPSPGGIVFVSHPFINLDVRVVSAGIVPAGTLNARLYSADESSRTCGRMHTGIVALAPGNSIVVRLGSLDEAFACGNVDRVQLWLVDSQGAVTLSTGTAQPDPAISMVFSP